MARPGEIRRARLRVDGGEDSDGAVGGADAGGGAAPRVNRFAERGAMRRSVVRRNQRQVQLVAARSEEHTSELQSRQYLVCRLLLEKKKNKDNTRPCCNAARSIL